MKTCRSNSLFNIEYIRSVRKDYYFLGYYFLDYYYFFRVLTCRCYCDWTREIVDIYNYAIKKKFMALVIKFILFLQNSMFYTIQSYN